MDYIRSGVSLYKSIFCKPVYVNIRVNTKFVRFYANNKKVPEVGGCLFFNLILSIQNLLVN